MEKEIKNLINKVKQCSKDVYEELGAGWSESVYQQALEVALREKGIDYEDQRVLPICFHNHFVGEGIPDLILWTKVGKKRIAVVIDLKWTSSVKEDHRWQVKDISRSLKSS